MQQVSSHCAGMPRGSQERSDGRSVIDRRRCIFAIILLSAAAAVSYVACEPGHTVTYENRTDKIVAVYRFGRHELDLQPGETAESSVLKFNQMPIEAKDESGTAVYSETLTWNELRANGWKIVITDSAGPVHQGTLSSDFDRLAKFPVLYGPETRQ